ncbi:Gar1 protein RNA binding region protein [Babesia caballi]|uniref:Gar1 protein RNA binding region protein n=1 Tax=Babesia caballi TaxID=5871 RepID=A0AAV4LXV5_BABCB|nr:Gar1 protein RNA binding region protein [Babesia caballi]
MFSRGRGGGRGARRGGSFGRGGRGGGGAGGYSGPPSEVIEAGTVVHDCEEQLVIKSTLEASVPYFNGRIFLANKQEIGKVDEILGPVHDYGGVDAEAGAEAILVDVPGAQGELVAALQQAQDDVAVPAGRPGSGRLHAVHAAGGTRRDPHVRGAGPLQVGSRVLGGLAKRRRSGGLRTTHGCRGWGTFWQLPTCASGQRVEPPAAALVVGDVLVYVATSAHVHRKVVVPGRELPYLLVEAEGGHAELLLGDVVAVVDAHDELPQVLPRHGVEHAVVDPVEQRRRLGDGAGEALQLQAADHGVLEDRLGEQVAQVGDGGHAHLDEVAQDVRRLLGADGRHVEVVGVLVMMCRCRGRREAAMLARVRGLSRGCA